MIKRIRFSTNLSSSTLLICSFKLNTITLLAPSKWSFTHFEICEEMIRLGISASQPGESLFVTSWPVMGLGCFNCKLSILDLKHYKFDSKVSNFFLLSLIISSNTLLSALLLFGFKD